MSDTRPDRTIFLSHTQADAATAREIAAELERLGVRVRRSEWTVSAGSPAIDVLDTMLAASDVILMLLSPSYVDSRWASEELSRSIDASLLNRAISVVPAVIADCEVPAALREMALIDLRTQQGMHDLLAGLGSIDTIDFEGISGQEFEDLVVRLLSETGFEIGSRNLAAEAGLWDALARYQVDRPSGSAVETWGVEVKRYRKDQRVGVQLLHELLGRLDASQAEKCLLVTSGQVTSVARSFVADANARSGRERLKLMEGSELTARLLEHPEIVSTFFGKSK